MNELAMSWTAGNVLHIIFVLFSLFSQRRKKPISAYFLLIPNQSELIRHILCEYWECRRQNSKISYTLLCIAWIIIFSNLLELILTWNAGHNATRRFITVIIAFTYVVLLHFIHWNSDEIESSRSACCRNIYIYTEYVICLSKGRTWFSTLISMRRVTRIFAVPLLLRIFYRPESISSFYVFVKLKCN